MGLPTICLRKKARRTGLLDQMFDQHCRKSAAGAEQVSDEIVATAQSIQNALSQSNGIGRPARGLFVLALQQVVDLFIASLLRDEAFECLAREQRRTGLILLGDIDLGSAH